MGCDLVSEHSFPRAQVSGTKEVEKTEEGDAVSTQMKSLDSSHVLFESACEF